MTKRWKYGLVPGWSQSLGSWPELTLPSLPCPAHILLTLAGAGPLKPQDRALVIPRGQWEA